MKRLPNIVAGENIPYLKEAFEGLGKLSIVPGRTITSANLKNTHILLIRSITQVDESLLQGTSVEFVGSASAGIDHLDTNYLTSRKIEFASASGSNANSVSEYIVAALLFLGKENDISLKGKTIGIVGVGHIGKLVKQKAEALGMYPVLNDPFLAETGEIDHCSLEETLGCDVVTLHTPLSTDGPYPTYHLLNDRTFKLMKPSAIFINAARGEVVETAALLKAIAHKRIGPTIIDVWENEPEINWDLFRVVTLGTPHIAGHSLDGKASGTFMIYRALCRHLGVEPTWTPAQSLPPSPVPIIEILPYSGSDQERCHNIVNKIYDIRRDHLAMNTVSQDLLHQRGQRFDLLRKNYPNRREFWSTAVTLPKNEIRLMKCFEGLGFA